MSDDAASEIQELRSRLHEYEDVLRSIRLADKTSYRHHEPRKSDGKPPKEGGGTRWMTPRELATEALLRANAPLSVTA